MYTILINQLGVSFDIIDMVKGPGNVLGLDTLGGSIVCCNYLLIDRGKLTRIVYTYFN